MIATRSTMHDVFVKSLGLSVCSVFSLQGRVRVWHKAKEIYRVG